MVVRFHYFTSVDRICFLVVSALLSFSTYLFLYVRPYSLSIPSSSRLPSSCIATLLPPGLPSLPLPPCLPIPSTFSQSTSSLLSPKSSYLFLPLPHIVSLPHILRLICSASPNPALTSTKKCQCQPLLRAFL